MKLSLICVFACSLVFVGCQTPSGQVARPTAVFSSQPVSSNEVQDVAFWIHPTDSSKSLMLITNELKGLEVHNVDGLLLKHLARMSNPKYVDVIYGFQLGPTKTDLVVASCAGEPMGVKVWRVDPEKSKLHDVTFEHVIKVLGGEEPLGLFCYVSPKTGRRFFFVTDNVGAVEQYELIAAEHELVSARLVRKFELEGKSKGGCADDERGVIYLSQDKVGVWQIDAEPDASSQGKLVIQANDHALVPNIRGPVLYRAGGGRGYLIVGSQGPRGGHSIVNVYDRTDHHFVMTIDPSSTQSGPIDHLSGLDVTNAPFGSQLSHGGLALNDQVTSIGTEDFKLFSWDEIARAGKLIVDVNAQPAGR